MSDEKLRRWMEYNSRFPTTGLAALAIVQRDDGLVLAISREHDHEDWTLPGGKLEPDEPWLTALVREVKEETLAEVSSAKLVYFGASTDGHLVRTYLCELEDQKVLERDTPEGLVRWIPPAKLVNGVFRAYNLEAFKAAKIDVSGEEPCHHESEPYEVRVKVCLECGAELSRS